MKLQAAAVEQFDQRDSQNDAKNAVIRTRAGNGVEVRSDEQPRRRWLLGGVAASEIAYRINRNAHAGLLHPGAEPQVDLAHRLGKKWPRRETGFRSAFRKRFATRDDAVSRGKRPLHQDPR